MSKTIALNHKLLNAVARSVNSSANVTLNDAIRITKGCNIVCLRAQIDLLEQYGKNTAIVSSLIEDLNEEYTKAVEDYETELKNPDAEKGIFEKSNSIAE